MQVIPLSQILEVQVNDNGMLWKKPSKLMFQGVLDEKELQRRESDFFSKLGNQNPVAS